MKRMLISVAILTASLIFNLSNASAVSFTPNEEKAIVIAMQNIMIDEINHGNHNLFFLIDPDNTYYTTANGLYDLYDENSFRASKILQDHSYKVISGVVDSIISEGGVATVYLKTSTPETPYRRPLKVKMYEAFNSQAFELNKGDYLSIFGLLLWEPSSNVNSLVFHATDLSNFMYAHAEYRLSALKDLLEKDTVSLNENDFKDLYVAVNISGIAKRNNDFDNLSDEEIREITSQFTVDYNNYNYFKNKILTNN